MSESFKIVLDGVQYSVEDFSSTVKDLVDVRQKWAEQGVTENLALMKTQTAIKALDNELIKAMKIELENNKFDPNSQPVVEPNQPV